MLRILLALVVCITCSQVNASFDDFKTKFKAYTDISSNAEAIREFDLGNQYADGDGLPRSDAQAFIWYEKSAKKGHPLAQSLVGAMYAEGKGTAVSQKKAAKWYQLAASQGHPLAQHNLGKMYEAGTGVSQSYADAIKWYKLAADQGLATAQNDLGIMYLDGKGIKKDRQKARELFSSAAMQNNAEAKRNLKLLEDETKKTIMKELYGDTPQGNDTITCKTRCTNGDCYRTYSDGRTVHFQAQMKLNPFTNQMEFDSGGC